MKQPWPRERWSAAGNAEVVLEDCVFGPGVVLQDDAEPEVPRNQGEHPSVGERPGAHVLKLALGQTQERRDDEVVDDIAGGGGDLPRDFETGEVLGPVLLPGEREVLRLDLDGVVQEPGAGLRTRQDARHARARHEVEQVLALDQPAARFRARHPCRVQHSVGRPVDVREDLLSLEDLDVGLQQAGGHPPVRPHGDARVRELGETSCKVS